MNDLTISEKVVCRLLEAAWAHYITLPAESRGEAMEFRRKLDEAAAVVKMRPAHRANAEDGAVRLGLPDTRTQDEKDYEFDRLLGGRSI